MTAVSCFGFGSSAAAEGDTDVKTIPPFWILLVFTAIAALAYFAVLKLRGM